MAGSKAPSISSVDIADDASCKDSTSRRVGKACDRCRLKKSKCDGRKPCTRCKADNQLCLFGERKRLKEKIYPKGYVELLEYQQALLVKAVQLLYRQHWSGPPLPEAKGAPLVHDILNGMGLLEDEDGLVDEFLSLESFTFEENPIKMQNNLVDSNVNCKRPSTSSNISDLPSVSSAHSAATNSPIGPFTPQDGQFLPLHPRFHATSSSTQLLETGMSFLPPNASYLLDSNTPSFHASQNHQYTSEPNFPPNPNVDAKTQAAIDYLRNKQRLRDMTTDIFNSYPFPNTYVEPQKPTESPEVSVEEDSFRDFMNLSTPLDWPEQDACR